MMDKITTIPTRHNDSRVPRGKRSDHDKKKGSTGFANEMEAQAAAVAAAQPLSQPLPKTPTASEQRSSSAKSANSTNTEDANAGLKPSKDLRRSGPMTASMLASQKGLPGFSNPLSKNWVFDGADKNPNLKSLLGTDSTDKANSLLQQLQGFEAGQKVLTQQGESIESLLLKARGEAAKTDETPGTGKSAQSQSDAGNITSEDALAILQQMKGEQSGQATAVQTDGDSDIPADLLSQLGGQGSVDHRSPGGGAPVNGAGTNGNHALSGADFLSTLSMVRGGAAGAQTGDSGAGSFSGQGANQPGVKLVGEGGLKKKQISGFGDAALDSLSQSAAAASGMTGANALSGVGPGLARPVEVSGHVTQGSMTQDRLTSESLAGLSSNIRNLTPQGGGEIRVRLRPENLGELHLRVVTDGKQVSLQVQAADEKAKKILEQSLSDLKDGLASHQLNLGRVEFAIAPAGQSLASDMGNDSRAQAQNHFSGSMQDMMNGRGGGHSNSGAREGSSGESWSSSPLRTAAVGRAASSRSSSAASGTGARRIDVRA